MTIEENEIDLGDIVDYVQDRNEPRLNALMNRGEWPKLHRILTARIRAAVARARERRSGSEHVP